MNVSGHPGSSTFTLDGAKLFGGRPVDVPARSAWMLPIGLDVPLGRIVEATAEVERADGGSLLLRPLGPGATLVLDSPHDLVADGATELHHDGHRWTATSPDGSPLHLRSTTTAKDFS